MPIPNYLELIIYYLKSNFKTEKNATDYLELNLKIEKNAKNLIYYNMSAYAYS